MCGSVIAVIRRQTNRSRSRKRDERTHEMIGGIAKNGSIQPCLRRRLDWLDGRSQH